MMARIWKKYSPYLHIIGFVILCAFTVGTKYSLFEAHANELANHEERIRVLETSNDKIVQRLDDIIDFFGIPHSNAPHGATP